ncbi:MAG: type IV pili methyl-accepting chemotaxis transducer N-terminal domain-containing protein [Burkholderiales bacterium]|nr:type IV pili methyl-accepting chemotaxis transducer N-terminal domain-containing protein [Burkholderiales bacterium]
MTRSHRWNLGAKLAMVATPFLVLTLLAISATLWVSWQLEGGAAAVNEAGRMRMQTYRMALSLATADAASLRQQLPAFEESLVLLRRGDPERPLFVPWDDTVRERFATVEQDWQRLRPQWSAPGAADAARLREQAAGFVAHIEALVDAIEAHMSRWTALQHLLQTVVLGLALAGAVALLLTGYRFVLEPVQQLKRAIERLQGGDFDARVASTSSDEFGTLATGFNDLAEHLQSMYRSLEAKVADKTRELQDKGERLQALYDMSTLMAQATTLETLADGFARRIAQVAHADGVAIRWSDEANRRYLLLASQGLPQGMREAEQCLEAGHCNCGAPQAGPGLRVIPIRAQGGAPLPHCAQAEFESLVALPIRLHERTMGELELFYNAQHTPSAAEQSLLEALAAHLAAAMENLRLDSLAKEAAVSQERNLLARELHDSIAQSLAFLKIQVQLMRDALASGDAARIQAVLGEIDAGVRESYGDVRELLLHFRTRANAEQIEPALQTTLRKFEHQSGITARLHMLGQGLPLAPDVQLQVLHIVQEALSNVRKHAHAHQVWLDVQQQPQWRFEVRDDGIGFDAEDPARSEAHVGLRIMAERAERIGATLELLSTPGRGSSMVLTLPPAVLPATAPAPEEAAA